MVSPRAPVLGRWPGKGGGRAWIRVKPVGVHRRVLSGWSGGDSEGCTGDGLRGVGPLGLDDGAVGVAPGGVAHRESRWGLGLRYSGPAVLAGSDLSELVHQVVRGSLGCGRCCAWPLRRWPGPAQCRETGPRRSRSSRNLSGYRRRLRGKPWPRPRSGTGARASPRAGHGFQVPLPLFSGYRISLTCRPKRPTPDNHRVKSISGAPRSGCPS